MADATPKRIRRQRITDDQLSSIIALRLQGVTVRETARRVGVWPSTVTARYREWLEETAADRAEQNEIAREEAVARYESAAAQAWTSWLASVAASEDGTGDPRFLAEYRQAVARADKIQGLEVDRTEISGRDGGPLEVVSPVDRLAEMLAVYEQHDS